MERTRLKMDGSRNVEVFFRAFNAGPVEQGFALSLTSSILCLLGSQMTELGQIAVMIPDQACRAPFPLLCYASWNGKVTFVRAVLAVASALATVTMNSGVR